MARFTYIQLALHNGSIFFTSFIFTVKYFVITSQKLAIDFCGVQDLIDLGCYDHSYRILSILIFT